MAEANESHATKTCPMCSMEIPATARKCAYCHYWQTRLNTLLSSPWFAMLVAGIPLLVFILAFAAILDSQFDRGEPYSKYAGQLTVSQTEMEFVDDARDDCGRNAWLVIIGKVKNRSPIGWKNVRYQVDFFNSAGEFLDTGQGESYTWHVPPGQEVGFKVRLVRDFAKDNYADYKVRIIHADDARKRF